MTISLKNPHNITKVPHNITTWAPFVFFFFQKKNSFVTFATPLYL
jgi:hypothetical protein